MKKVKHTHQLKSKSLKQLKPVKKQFLKIILVFFALSFVVIGGSSYVTLKIGNVYFSKGNYSKSYSFYKVSYLLSFGLNKRADLRMNKSQEESLLKQPNNNGAQVLQTIPLDKISIAGKRVVVKEYARTNNSVNYEDITLSTIVLNNSGVGIPVVKIKKVTLYDSSHNQVAVKTDINDSFPLVSQGEFPFSFAFYIENSKPIEVKDFDLELEIPPFRLNKNVARLKTSNLTRISTETIDMYPNKGNVYNFEYRVTLMNDTDKKVDNIRYISLLKHNGFALTRLGTACCPQVTFTNKNNNGSQVLNLNDATYSYSLNPGESKEYNFKIGTDPLLIDSLINPNEIQLVIYFFGTTN